MSNPTRWTESRKLSFWAHTMLDNIGLEPSYQEDGTVDLVDRKTGEIVVEGADNEAIEQAWTDHEEYDVEDQSEFFKFRSYEPFLARLLG